LTLFNLNSGLFFSATEVMVFPKETSDVIPAKTGDYVQFSMDFGYFLAGNFGMTKTPN